MKSLTGAIDPTTLKVRDRLGLLESCNSMSVFGVGVAPSLKRGGVNVTF